MPLLDVRDREALETLVTTLWDFVVVGAGASGCVLAARLAGALPDCRILLLDPGGPPERDGRLASVIHAPARWAASLASATRFISVPQRHLCNRSIFNVAGHGFGGTSNVNACIWFRGAGHVFDSWRCAGWSYDELRGEFEGLESGGLSLEQPGREGALAAAFCEAARECGFSENQRYNEIHTEGFGYTWQTVRKGTRQTTWQAFVEPALGSCGNLYVAGSTGVRRLLFNSDAAVPQVEGVEVDFTTHKQRAGPSRGVIRLRPSGEVLLCAGSLESPRLLVASGVGSPEDVERAGAQPVALNEGVGRNLQDHVLAVSAFASPKPIAGTLGAGTDAQVLARSSLSGKDVGPDLQLLLLSGRHYITDAALISYVAPHQRTALPLLVEELLFQFPPGRFLRRDGLLARALGAALRLLVALLIALPFVSSLLSHLWFILAVNLRPESRGRLFVERGGSSSRPGGGGGGSGGGAGRVVLDPGYLSAPLDAPRSVEALALAHRIARSPALRPFFAFQLLPPPWAFGFPWPWRWRWRSAPEKNKKKDTGGLLNYVRRFANTTFHVCGTAAMGSNPDSALDEELRVRGVSGVRVADASSIPVIPSANIQAAVLVIAARAAKLIAQRRSRALADKGP
eukprot:tig00020734_g13575.t1